MNLKRVRNLKIKLIALPFPAALRTIFNLSTCKSFQFSSLKLSAKNDDNKNLNFAIFFLLYVIVVSDAEETSFFLFVLSSKLEAKKRENLIFIDFFSFCFTLPTQHSKKISSTHTLCVRFNLISSPIMFLLKFAFAPFVVSLRFQQELILCNLLVRLQHLSGGWMWVQATS